MSQRNGDKSRFNRIRKKTIGRRERQRIMLAGAHISADTKTVAGKKPSRNQPTKQESSPALT
jgi:hypothetical protein